MDYPLEDRVHLDLCRWYPKQEVVFCPAANLLAVAARPAREAAYETFGSALLYSVL